MFIKKKKIIKEFSPNNKLQKKSWTYCQNKDYTIKI
jgi:hypothetical protein